MRRSSARESGLPSCAGSYVLVMQAATAASPMVGRLGVRTLGAGWYLYVGSAQGPGGIAARCGRHLRSDKRLRWHVDYLLAALRLQEVWFRCDAALLEHQWAGVLHAWPAFEVAWPGFGASDCRCTGHLIYSADEPRLADAGAIFGGRGPDRVMRKE